VWSALIIDWLARIGAEISQDFSVKCWLNFSTWGNEEHNLIPACGGGIQHFSGQRLHVHANRGFHRRFFQKFYFLEQAI
jgi:hypothetical protein